MHPGSGQTIVRPGIHAGQLRRRITVQQSTSIPDGSLGFSTTWAVVPNSPKWAAIEPLTGQERLEYAQLYPTLSVRVTVRYWNGASPKMRVLYGSRTFEVLEVKDTNEAHKESILMCKELGVA